MAFLKIAAPEVVSGMSGESEAKIRSLFKEAREQGLAAPVVLMGYYNPFRAYGLEKLAADAAAAGVDGFAAPFAAAPFAAAPAAAAAPPPPPFAAAAAFAASRLLRFWASSSASRRCALVCL